MKFLVRWIFRFVKVLPLTFMLLVYLPAILVEWSHSEQTLSEVHRGQWDSLKRFLASRELYHTFPWPNSQFYVSDLPPSF